MLQRQSSRLILTATFCHLSVKMATVNDVISTQLINRCGRTLFAVRAMITLSCSESLVSISCSISEIWWQIHITLHSLRRLVPVLRPPEPSLEYPLFQTIATIGPATSKITEQDAILKSSHCWY